MNYTKRVNLRREHVEVSLGPENGHGVRTFSVDLKLPDGLSEDAMLSLEAYNSSPPVRMRFDLGTVGNIVPLTPDKALLTEFPKEIVTPLFRLKVIDPGEMRGRLLADARQIRPVNAADKKESRQGLLYIGHQDLGGVVWELEVERAGFEPTLWIDIEADPTRELARNSKFIALVYPEVLRGVLTHLIIDEEMNTIDDDSEWGHEWYQLAAGLPDMAGVDLPRDEAEKDERREWIARAVKAFARQTDVRSLICPQEEGSA